MMCAFCGNAGTIKTLVPDRTKPVGGRLPMREIVRACPACSVRPEARMTPRTGRAPLTGSERPFKPTGEDYGESSSSVDAFEHYAGRKEGLTSGAN